MQLSLVIAVCAALLRGCRCGAGAALLLTCHPPPPSHARLSVRQPVCAKARPVHGAVAAPAGTRRSGFAVDGAAAAVAGGAHSAPGTARPHRRPTPAAERRRLGGEDVVALLALGGGAGRAAVGKGRGRAGGGVRGQESVGWGLPEEFPQKTLCIWKCIGFSPNA